MPVLVRMPSHLPSCIAALLVFASLPAAAQEVIREDETLDGNRPEAWAMHYRTASTLMTAFGPSPAIAPWHWQAAFEPVSYTHLRAHET